MTNPKSPKVYLGCPFGSAGKESTCNAGDLGSIPGLGKFSGEGKGYPLQYSGLKNSMDYIVHGVAKNQTQLSDFHLQSLLTSWQLGSPLLIKNPSTYTWGWDNPDIEL